MPRPDSVLQGARYLLIGLRWLPKAGVRGFVALPLAISSLLFGGAIWWGVNQLERLSQALRGWLPSWLGWLDWLLWPLFGLIALVALFFSFSVVANLIAAPFNGWLAERVEQIAANEAAAPLPPAPRFYWQDLAKVPFTELRRVLHYLAWLIPLLILSVLPLSSVIAPVLWALYGAWMLAQEYASYPLERRGLSLRQQRRWLRQHWPLTLGFGAMTLVLTLIPVVNFLAMPAAVIGATLLWRQVPATTP